MKDKIEIIELDGDELAQYKADLSKLSDEEKAKRNLYLKEFNEGKYQGPMAGKPSLDKKHLVNYSYEQIESTVPNISAYQQLVEGTKGKEKFVALRFYNQKITYEKLFKNIDRVASYLIKSGVKKGDCISVCLPNIPEAAYIFYAINKIGATANMLDVRFKANRLRDCINEVKSNKIFIFDNCLSELDSIIDETSINEVIPISVVESISTPIKQILKTKVTDKEKSKFTHHKLIRKFSHVLKTNPNLAKNINVYDETVPAAYEHTSGTTGNPKTVSLLNKTFTGLTTNYSNFNFDRSFAPHEVFLNIIPPFLAYGLVPSLHFPLSNGMDTVLIPTFNEEEFFGQLMKYKPQHTNATKMHWACVKKHIDELVYELLKKKEELNKKKVELERLKSEKYFSSAIKRKQTEILKLEKQISRDEENINKIDFSYLVTAGIGGDTVQAEFIKELDETLKKYNCKYGLALGFGMTEVGSTFTIAPGTGLVELGSVGIPLVHNEVMIYDEENKKELSYGEKGDLYIKGPTMMKEYVGNDDGTKETLVVINGSKWIRTGDIAHMDTNGALYIDGRKKRMIITDGGNKVFPFAIESVIAKHPAVADSCVVGVPDDYRINTVKAHIILKPEYVGKEEQVLSEIEKICENEIPDQSLPSEYQFDEAFPKTPNGKVDYNLISQIDLNQKNKTKSR